MTKAAVLVGMQQNDDLANGGSEPAQLGTIAFPTRF
jgi:hypothetical protein